MLDSSKQRKGNGFALFLGNEWNFFAVYPQAIKKELPTLQLRAFSICLPADESLA